MRVLLMLLVCWWSSRRAVLVAGQNNDTEITADNNNATTPTTPTTVTSPTASPFPTPAPSLSPPPTIAPSNDPTAAPNECVLSLRPGDITVFIINADNPDQVAFFVLADVSHDVGHLYITDKAWNGQDFVSLDEDEAVAEFTIPEEGFKPGDKFGYGANSPFAENWTVVDNKIFDIGVNGDHVFLYCLTADNEPHFIWGFSMNGPWIEPGLPDESYGLNASALPASLAENGNVALPHADNFFYKGPTTGGKDAMLSNFANPKLYEGRNESRFEANFEDTSSAIMAAASRQSLLFTTGAVAILLMMTGSSATTFLI